MSYSSIIILYGFGVKATFIRYFLIAITLVEDIIEVNHAAKVVNIFIIFGVGFHYVVQNYVRNPNNFATSFFKFLFRV